MRKTVYLCIRRRVKDGAESSTEPIIGRGKCGMSSHLAEGSSAWAEGRGELESAFEHTEAASWSPLVRAGGHSGGGSLFLTIRWKEIGH